MAADWMFICHCGFCNTRSTTASLTYYISYHQTTSTWSRDYPRELHKDSNTADVQPPAKTNVWAVLPYSDIDRLAWIYNNIIIDVPSVKAEQLPFYNCDPTLV